MKQGTKYKNQVDETVKKLLNSKRVDDMEVTRLLNQSFRQLESTAYAEREALKNVLVSNLALSKAVGQLAVMLNTANERIAKLEQQLAFIQN